MVSDTAYAEVLTCNLVLAFLAMTALMGEKLKARLVRDEERALDGDIEWD